MAKQPASDIADNPRQTRLFLFIILGLSLITLLCLGYTQLASVHAQTSPTTVDFGSAPVGTQGATHDVTFSVSQAMTTSYSVNTNFNGGSSFSLLSDGCSASTVDPGGSCSVTIRFSPASPGPQTGSVTFDYSPAQSGQGAEGARINSVGSSTTNIRNSLYAPAQQTPSTTTNLTGLGTVTTTAPPTTTVAVTTAPPTTTVAATTRPANNCGSQIQGYVLIDGQPGAGVGVKLTGPTNATATIGDGGFFYFNNLCAGNYQISLEYDHTKYKANDADVRTFKLDGANPSRNNAFSLSTAAATTAAPTTAAPTTPPTGTTVVATSAPTTPPATTPPASEPNCNLPSGTVLRVCVGTTQQSPTHFAVILKVLAGDSPVDLNDTVIVSLPAGAIVTSATSALGAVSVSTNNTVRWGSFSLSPKQSANIVLSIDAPSGNLNGSSIFVSGSFNRSQAFQQRIPGLPGLTDIFAAAPQTTGTGGQGGGSAVPVQAPATGTGQENSQDAPVFWLILAAIVSGSLAVFGLVMTGRTRKSGNKEQK